MAVEFISSGIISSGLNITDNQIIILTGGSGDSLTVAGPSGELTVSSGGKATSTFINEGGKLIVAKEGTATVVNLSSGGFLNTSAGEITDITIAAGATVNGFLINNDITTTSIIDGAFKVSGASVQNTSAHIYSGGTATNTTVMNGGNLFVSNGGKAYQVTLKKNAFLNVFEYATVLNLSADADSIINGFTLSNKIENQDIINGAFKVSGASVQNTSAHIYSGGTATSTSVISGGLLLVSSGGTALDTIVDSAFMGISSGGTAASTAVINEGLLLVLNGGTALNTTVDNAFMNIYSGGEANQVTLKGNAFLNVFEYATVLNLSADADSIINGFTLSNKIENQDIINGAFKVSSASVQNTSAHIYSGGTATNTSVISGGHLLVSRGGMATNTSVSRGSLFVLGAGSAFYTTLNTSGHLTVRGFAQDTLVNSSATISVKSNGRANLLNILQGGKLETDETANVNNIAVDAGGLINGFTINNRIENTNIVHGAFKVSSASVKDSDAWIYNGGSALSTTIERGKALQLHSGGTALDTAIISGSMIVNNAGSATRTTVYTKGFITISSSGTVTDTTVFGSANLNSGGFAKNTTVTGSAVFNIHGSAVNTVLSDGAKAVVNKDASARYATISSGGKMTVLEQGNAANVSICFGGELVVSAGASASYVYNPWGGTLTPSEGAYVSALTKYGIYLGNQTSGIIETAQYKNSHTVTSGLSMIVISNGTAASTKVEEGAVMLVSSGGRATGTTVGRNGSMTVNSSARISVTTVEEAGSLVISNGGLAYDTELKSGAKMTISSGGSGCMTAITKGATLHVSSGGYAQIVFNPWGGEYTSESGAIVDEQKTHCIYVGNKTSGVTERFDSSNDYKISCGLSMMIYEHGTAMGTTIKENAKMVIFDQGFAANANLKNGAVLSIENGGTAVNLQTESGANLTVSAGGMLTGCITLSDKTDITMLEGSIICFNLGYQQGVTEKELAGKARQKYALLNNYEIVSSGAQSYKLILKNDMKAGEIYVLADNTAGFSKTIEILDRSLKLNETIRHGKRFYQLCNDEYVFSDTNQENSSLTLKVYNEVKGDIDGNGISDVLFQYNGDDRYKGQLGFWMNGTNEWQSDGVAQPTEWEVIGVRDMNADGKADIVMRANTDVNGIKGAYIGYYVNGDTGKWQNIGYLTIEEDDKWEAKVGNVTGTGGKSSIIWHCAEKHAIGVWKDGTDEWIQIGHYFEDDVKFIGTADFNGDNKDEILLQKGGLFYTVDIDSTDIKPKCNTLGELYGGWEVAAVGDFAGDGKDDLILYYEALGLVIHCNDGFISNWKQLGQLDHKDWKIAGSGDYNGDGKDDLLVRQQSTGLLGYYDGGDMTKWKEMGNGVNQNWALFSEI